MKCSPEGHLRPRFLRDIHLFLLLKELPMKKLSIALLAALALLITPVTASAAPAPKPGASCEMKGAVMTMKSLTYV